MGKYNYDNMSDKERLAVIKKILNWDSVYVGKQNIEWLVTQAEKYEKSKEGNNG